MRRKFPKYSARKGVSFRVENRASRGCKNCAVCAFYMGVLRDVSAFIDHHDGVYLEKRLPSFCQDTSESSPIVPVAYRLK